MEPVNWTFTFVAPGGRGEEISFEELPGIVIVRVCDGDGDGDEAAAVPWIERLILISAGVVAGFSREVRITVLPEGIRAQKKPVPTVEVESPSRKLELVEYP